MSRGPTAHQPFTSRVHRALQKKKGQRPLFGPNLRLQSPARSTLRTNAIAIYGGV